METSYQERNHWIGLGIAVWATAYYFIRVLGLEGGLSADIQGVLPILVATTIYSIIAGIVLSILNRCLSRDRTVEKDERDTQIELMGFRNAFYACSGMLWVVLMHALINERFRQIEHDSWHLETLNFLVHSVFLVAWISYIVQSLTHLFYYRRGLA